MHVFAHKSQPFLCAGSILVSVTVWSYSGSPRQNFSSPTWPSSRRCLTTKMYNILTSHPVSSWCPCTFTNSTSQRRRCRLHLPTAIYQTPLIWWCTQPPTTLPIYPPTFHPPPPPIDQLIREIPRRIPQLRRHKWWVLVGVVGSHMGQSHGVLPQ